MEGVADLKRVLQQQEAKIRDQALEMKSLQDNLDKAGLFGTQLLNTKHELESKLKHIQSSQQQKIELLEQERHSLKLQLDSATQVQRNQASDIEQLQDKLINARNSISEKSKADHQNFILRLREADELLEEHRAQEEQYLTQIQHWKREFESAKFANNSSLIALDKSQHEEEITRLTLLLEENERTRETLESSLAIIEGKFQDTQAIEKRLRSRVERLEQNLEEKERELATASNLLDEKRIEVMELEALAEANKMAQVDPSKRGNSLFGEVEDRRKQVEKQMASLHARHEKALLQNAALTAKNTSLKNDITNLMCTAANRDNSAYIQQLEMLVHSLRSQASTLAEKLRDSNSSHTISPRPGGTKESPSSVIEVLLQQAQTRVKTVEEELHKERLYRIAQTDQVLSAIKGKREAEKQVDKYRAENYRLQTKLGELETQLLQPGTQMLLQPVMNHARIVEKVPCTTPAPVCPITEHHKSSSNSQTDNGKEKGDLKVPILTEHPARTVRIKENVQVHESNGETYEQRLANESQTAPTLPQEGKSTRGAKPVKLIRVESNSSANECTQQ